MANELTAAQEEIVLQGFEKVRFYCKYKETSVTQAVLSMLAFRMSPNLTPLEKSMSILCKDSSNYKGGIGSVRTIHENMFFFLNDHLEQQVVFGTGKGGKKRFHCGKYTVDFFDASKNRVIEIDGSSHLSELARLKDEIRTLFFKLKGIEVVRFSNNDVEVMMLSFLRHFYSLRGETSFISDMNNIKGWVKK